MPVFALVATLASLTSFYAAGGHALVDRALSSHPPANKANVPPAFTLSNVTTRIDTTRGAPVFVIRGDIKAENAAGPVPNLNVTFADLGTGGSVVYAIPRGELLKQGETIRFSTRIAAGTHVGTDPQITLDGQ